MNEDKDKEENQFVQYISFKKHLKNSNIKNHEKFIWYQKNKIRIAIGI